MKMQILLEVKKKLKELKDAKSEELFYHWDATCPCISSIRINYVLLDTDALKPWEFNPKTNHLEESIHKIAGQILMYLLPNRGETLFDLKLDEKAKKTKTDNM